VRSPAELVDRRAELEQLMHTAPPDQHAFIERLTRADLGPGELHDELLAATHAQDARRDWITANWPHVVELEQINTLSTAQPALAHWPTAQPEPVQHVLDTLRLLAPTADRREERTLAEIEQQAIANDPVRQLEERRAQLRQLYSRAVDPARRDTIDNELTGLNDQLRAARREQAVERVFDRYLPNPTDDARATRITTLAHDSLTAQPAWVVEHIRYLHYNDLLTTCDTPTLATRIIQVAAHHDLHGQLPATWPAPLPPTVEFPHPSIDVG
jgi:hypothetical protein